MGKNFAPSPWRMPEVTIDQIRQMLALIMINVIGELP